MIWVGLCSVKLSSVRYGNLYSPVNIISYMLISCKHKNKIAAQLLQTKLQPTVCVERKLMTDHNDPERIRWNETLPLFY